MMIEETIKLVTKIEKHTASTGDNLNGMEIDIEHYFSTSDVFSLVSLKSSEDKECMFNISVAVSKSVEELHEIRRALNDAWDFIKYSYFEASSLNLSKSKAELRFVTTISENAFYVTGKVIVVGTHYEYLAKNQ